jgi:DNA-binding NarL/FixJ family response regulator
VYCGRCQHMALSEQRNSAREVCLVADDDEFFRVALRSILLNKLGYSHVVEAGSLNEAMKQLSETGPIALAIFDLAMPGMESASSLRAVRQRFPGTQVAVVSASKRRSDILQALEAGAHGYVPKGLGAAELSRALQTIRDGLIYVPPHLADVSCPEEARRLDSFNSLIPGLEPARLPTGLTARQRDVLELLVLGLSNKEIARALNLGEGTVKVHMAALFRTLGVTSRAAAAATGTQLSRRS